MKTTLLILASIVSLALVSCESLGAGTSLVFDPVTGTWRVQVEVHPQVEPQK